MRFTERPFNWKREFKLAEKFGYFSDAAKVAARGWQSCAVGTHARAAGSKVRVSIDFTKTGPGPDERLQAIGTNFNEAVSHDLIEGAKMLYADVAAEFARVETELELGLR